MSLEIVKKFLKSHNVINLSYIADGSPQSCALWYASDQNLNLYFLSSIKTKHGKTLLTDGDVAFTINKDQQPWNLIRGLQGLGSVSSVDKNNHNWKAYTDKFPFVKNQSSVLLEAIKSTQMFCLKPTWIRLIDNSVSFAYKEEYSAPFNLQN